MAPQVFLLKEGDTLPALDVYLLRPDGTAQDLAGTTGWKLHVHLADGTRLVRDMMKVGADVDGHLRYLWSASDWGDASTPDGDGSFTVGGLVAGPPLPLARGQREHRMEYEVLGAGGVRLTFPNGGDNAREAYDTLRVWSDIGDGA